MLENMIYGVLNLSFWQYVIVTFIMGQITIAAVTLYLHRCQTHRGLDLHPIPSHFFRCWLWLTTGMETKEWVAIHRKHHAKCETPEDPHSPQILGIKTLLFQGAELYRKEKHNKDTMERYGHGTPDDWLERNVYRHSVAGIGLLAVLDLVLFGLPGITIWAIQMMVIPFCAAGIVNGVGHYWGYRNFECPDQARNVSPLGLLLGGEELHNNHHTFPTSAKLSVKPWEFDIGWLYICVLKFFKLAKVRRLPPEVQTLITKSQIDIDTISAIVSSKFQLMASYSRNVILPVLREESHKAGEAGRSLLKRAKGLLIRADNLIDEKGKQRIAALLENHCNLKTVYQYRLKLQEIWSRTTANHRELIEALQEWCKQAEATGISVLQKFASELKHYSIRNRVPN